LHADAYTGYDAIFLGTRSDVIEVACWSHARRRFFDAAKSSPRESHQVRLSAPENDRQDSGKQQYRRRVLWWFVLRHAELTFPILIDKDKRNWDAWGNSMWPSVYLIDRAGYVRSWWYGELNWQGAEGEQQLRQRIEQLLDASDADALTPGLRHQTMTRERRMDAVAGPIFRRRRFDALVEHRLEWHERQVEFIR
jgi:hypothetical protein